MRQLIDGHRVATDGSHMQRVSEGKGDSPISRGSTSIALIIRAITKAQSAGLHSVLWSRVHVHSLLAPISQGSFSVREQFPCCSKADGRSWDASRGAQ
jgi:hypothetical protein